MAAAEASSTPTAAFRIELPQFEGPLDLLLHLIQKHELDIADLPIAFVTERYLHYLGMMRAVDLDVASEYLVMAATLAYLKSKSLLPPEPEEPSAAEEVGEEIDTRAELIKRLLEYQKYKRAAEQLGQQPLLGRDVFARNVNVEEADPGPAPLAPTPIFKLLEVLQQVLARVDGRRAFTISSERVSIQDRMASITERLQKQRTCEFIELFAEAQTRYDVIVTFLAVLEMGKVGLISIYQADNCGSIYLEARFTAADSNEVEHNSP